MIPQISTITSGCNSIDLFDPLKPLGMAFFLPSPLQHQCAIKCSSNKEEKKVQCIIIVLILPPQCNTRKEK